MELKKDYWKEVFFILMTINSVFAMGFAVAYPLKSTYLQNSKMLKVQESIYQDSDVDLTNLTGLRRNFQTKGNAMNDNLPAYSIYLLSAYVSTVLGYYAFVKKGKTNRVQVFWIAMLIITFFCYGNMISRVFRIIPLCDYVSDVIRSMGWELPLIVKKCKSIFWAW